MSQDGRPPLPAGIGAGTGNNTRRGVEHPQNKYAVPLATLLSPSLPARPGAALSQRTDHQSHFQHCNTPDPDLPARGESCRTWPLGVGLSPCPGLEESKLL